MRRAAITVLIVLSAAGLVTAGPATAAPVAYEAEQATIVNGVVESNHAGFTGTGFVNSANAAGATVEFSVQMTSAASRTLRFRNANGATSNRPATLTVNGVTHSTLLFQPTGSWTTWLESSVGNVALVSGTNTVRVASTTGNGLPNLDSLTVDDGPGGSGPVEDPIPSPVTSGLGLVLTEYASFPKTNPVPAPTDSRLNRQARINYLGELPPPAAVSSRISTAGSTRCRQAAAPRPPTSTSVRRWGATSSPDGDSAVGPGSSPSTRSSRRTDGSTPPTRRRSTRSVTSRRTGPSPARSSTASSPSGPPATRRPRPSAGPGGS